MVFIVASKKGGCGKSTFAMQILTGYCVSRQREFKVIEVDEINRTLNTFNNSKSLKTSETLSIDAFMENAMEHFSNKDSDLILDTGGNKTGDEFLERMSIYLKQDIRWFIPILKDNPSSSSGAFEVVQQIFASNKDAKMCMVLTPTVNIDAPKLEHIKYFGHDALHQLPNFSREYYNLLGKAPTHVIVPYSNALELSNIMGSTYHDFLNDYDMNEIQEKIQAVTLKGDKAQFVVLSYIGDTLRLADKLQKQLERVTFKQIDSFIGEQSPSKD